MQAALQQLHNLSVPNLEVVAKGFLSRTLRSDIFYKLFLAINGKVAEGVSWRLVGTMCAKLMDGVYDFRLNIYERKYESPSFLADWGSLV